MKNRTVVLALVIGLLVGAAGVVLLVVTEDDGGTALDAGLPKLPSALGGDRTSAAADMSMPAPVTYQVRGELPDLPDHARAYRTAGGVEQAAVRRLAGALGLSGEVTRARDGWQVVDGDQRLVVGTSSAGAWSFGPAEECVERLERGDAGPDGAASCTVSSPVQKCAPDGTCEEPPRRTDLPSQEDARRIAVDALDEGGIDTSGSVQVLQAFDAWEVLTERRIDGRPTHGLSTHLSVGPQGELIRGGGLLGTMEEVGDYPLVDVQAGVERLRAQAVPHPMLSGGREPAIAIAPVPPDGGGPGGPTVRTITDAELGLMPVYVDERTWLEPAFLFELDDKDTIAVPAVVDALLEAPFGPAPKPAPGPPDRVDPAPPSDGGGSGGSDGSGGSQTCAGSAAASSSSAEGDNQALTVEVCATPSRVAVGETVTFSFKAHDPDAAIDADGCQQPRAAYGDEGEGTAQCLALCSRDTYPPEATTLAKTFTHAYARPGTYTATFTVGSCAPKASSGQVEVQITVSG